MTEGAEVQPVRGPERPPGVREYRLKRLLDVVLVLVSLPVTLPVGFLCGVAVGLTSRGGVFFAQQRAGRGGRPFRLLKFRSMVAGDNPLVPSAAHITAVGRFLRRTSLDEIPQLINVLRGEMSIVGPRPMLLFQADMLDDRQRGRLAVRPGITGLAQVRGRNAMPWAERIELDLEYIVRSSLRDDVAIILHTVTQVGGGEGVSGHPEDDPFVQAPSEPGS